MPAGQVRQVGRFVRFLDFQRRASANADWLETASSFAVFDHLDVVRRADLAEPGGSQPVGDEGMDFGHVADADRGGPVELRAVTN